MSFIARMQKNDRPALEELFQQYGSRFETLARALGQQPSAERMKEIVWDASVLFQEGQSDLAFALAKLAEGLVDHAPELQTPTLNATVVAGLAARTALKLGDDAEARTLAELTQNAEALAIAEKVKAAIATALAATPTVQF